jgi:predicted ATP-grasp superfamily ATP-dependent carboligase
VAERAIVPDDVQRIQRHILQWTDAEDYFNLIITTGGTGFAQKDHTPEVGANADMPLKAEDLQDLTILCEWTCLLISGLLNRPSRFCFTNMLRDSCKPRTSS